MNKLNTIETFIVRTLFFKPIKTIDRHAYTFMLQ